MDKWSASFPWPVSKGFAVLQMRPKPKNLLEVFGQGRTPSDVKNVFTTLRKFSNSKKGTSRIVSDT